MTPKIETRILRADIADGLDEAADAAEPWWRCDWGYDHDEWADVPAEWLWAKRAQKERDEAARLTPRRWIAPVSA